MVKPKGGTTMAIIKRRYKSKNHKKPVIYYQVEIFVKGVRVSTKTFSTNREAVFWHKREKHKYTLSPQSLNDQILLKECVDKFWESAQTRMMKSTLQGYRSELPYICSSPLANVKMSELKGMKVVDWISWLKKQPTAKNKGRKSFINELKLLSAILNWYGNFLNEDFNVPITKKHR